MSVHPSYSFLDGHPCDTVPEVRHHIHERLVAVVDELRDILGQRVNKAVLTSLANVPVEYERLLYDAPPSPYVPSSTYVPSFPYVPSSPLPSLSPLFKAENLCPQMIDTQLEDDAGCPASPFQVTSLKPANNAASQQWSEKSHGQRHLLGKQKDPTILN